MEASKAEWGYSENYWGAWMIALRTILASVVIGITSFSPGSALESRGLFISDKVLHLFWLRDALRIKNPQVVFSAFIALLTKMAAEILAPGG